MTFIQELKQAFREFVFLKKMKIKIKIYMKLADYKHYITNKRYFVIPAVGYGMRVLCNTEIKNDKKGKGVKPCFHYENKNGKKVKVYDRTNGTDKHSFAGGSKKTNKDIKQGLGIKQTDGYNEIKEKCFYMTPLQRSGAGAPTIEEREAMRLRFEKFAGFAKRIDPKI